MSSKETFNFTLGSRCNIVLLRLSLKAKKLKATSNSTFENNGNSSELETYDLTTLANYISESEEKFTFPHFLYSRKTFLTKRLLI